MHAEYMNISQNFSRKTTQLRDGYRGKHCCTVYQAPTCNASITHWRFSLSFSYSISNLDILLVCPGRHGQTDQIISPLLPMWKLLEFLASDLSLTQPCLLQAPRIELAKSTLTSVLFGSLNT